MTYIEPPIDLDVEMGSFEEAKRIVNWVRTQLVECPDIYEDTSTFGWIDIITEEHDYKWLEEPTVHNCNIIQRIVTEASLNLTVDEYGMYTFNIGDGQWEWCDCFVEPVYAKYLDY